MSRIKTKLKWGGLIIPAVLFGFMALSNPVKAEEYGTKQKDARITKPRRLEWKNARKLQKAIRWHAGPCDIKEAVASTKEAIEYDNSHLSDKELKHQENKN
jgi:hypothetical protein